MEYFVMLDPREHLEQELLIFRIVNSSFVVGTGEGLDGIRKIRRARPGELSLAFADPPQAPITP